MVRSLLAVASLTAALKVASAATPLPPIIDFPAQADKKPDTSLLTAKVQKCALAAAESITIPNSSTYVTGADAAKDEVRVLKSRLAILKSGSQNQAIVLDANTPKERRLTGYGSHDIGVEVNTSKDTNGNLYAHFIARHDGSYDKTQDALVGGISITVSPEGKTVKRQGNVSALAIGIKDSTKLAHYEWTKQAVQSMEYAFAKCSNIEIGERPANAATEVTTPVPYKAGVSAYELKLIQ